MRYTLTILGQDFQRLLDCLYERPEVEAAAYLRCGRGESEGEVRFLVKEVMAVRDEHYLVRERDRLSLDSTSYAAATKRAIPQNDSLILVHSHPTGIRGFSPQDDREEPKLMTFFASRLGNVPHGSLVLDAPESMVGRVWVSSQWRTIDRVRIIGERFRFLDTMGDSHSIPQFYDRQVRAFGTDVQRLLRRLHIGVVGAGGTGSAVIEQLTRLGVGILSVFDGDAMEESNVNRVYGSAVGDAGRPKTDIAATHVGRIGLGTMVRNFPRPITEEATAKKLRECDIVFGCTDKHAPRGILVRLALRYFIPLIDLGVTVKSEGGVIRGVFGRVTTVFPGEACLFCRDRISPEMIRLESLTPTEQRALADENYAPELEEAAPAVIMFTTAVAAQAITELLHRLTGFMGAERLSTEVLLMLHETALRRNRTQPKSDCLCSQRQNWGRGDGRSFLGITWPEPSRA